MKKNGKCAEEQDNGPNESFQNYDFYQAWYLHKWKEPRFQHYEWQIWFEGDLFVRNLDAGVELREVPVPAAFYQGLSSAFDFSMSKDFSIRKELPRVNFVKCAM